MHQVFQQKKKIFLMIKSCILCMSFLYLNNSSRYPCGLDRYPIKPPIMAPIVLYYVWGSYMHLVLSHERRKFIYFIMNCFISWNYFHYNITLMWNKCTWAHFHWILLNIHFWLRGTFGAVWKHLSSLLGTQKAKYNFIVSETFKCLYTSWKNGWSL